MVNKFDRSAILIVVLVASSISCFLVISFDDGILRSDFAQMVSVARNIIAGEGLRTSLVYYDVHYALAPPPVPQTVFPPGLSVVISPLLAVGVSPGWATFSICAIAWLSSGILIFRSMQLTNCPTSVTSLLTSTWFIIGVNWSSVLLCRSEAVLVALTCFGLYATVRWENAKANKRSWLLAIGVAAGAGVLVRYQGAFFVLSVGLLFFLRFTAKPSLDRVKDFIVVAVVPLVVVVTIVLYNNEVAGNVSGGPLDNVSYRTPLSGVLMSFYFELSKILGVSKSGLVKGGVSEIFLLLLISFSSWSAWRFKFHRNVFPVSAGNAALKLCLCYLIVSITSLFYLSAMRSLGYVQERYISTLAPFVLFALAFVLRAFVANVGVSRIAKWLGGALFAGFVVFGQLRVAGEQLEDISSDMRLTEIRGALNTEHNGTTLKQFLQYEIDRGRNVFGHQSQLTGHELDRPTFGLTPAFFTTRIFDYEQVSALAINLKIKYLIFYPQLYNSGASSNKNRVVLTELSANNVPESLIPLVMSERVQLFEFDLENMTRSD